MFKAHKSRSDLSLALATAIFFLSCSTATGKPRTSAKESAASIASSNTWRGLVVAPENRCQPYSSSDYPYSQSLETQLTMTYQGVYGPYTGKWFSSPSETDIEHIVAKSEAHDSGLCSASSQQKKAFSGDLLNLTLAGPTLNRYQKSGKDASEWVPPVNKCWFAHQVVLVKKKYQLTVDQREANALESILSGCESVTMIFYKKPPSQGSTTPKQKEPQDTTDFKNCTALKRSHPGGVTRGHPAYKKKFDRDGDGHACE